MALVSRQVLFQNVSTFLQFKRFRGKIVVQKPRAPHFDKAKYLAMTKPIFISPNKSKRPHELCEGFRKTKKEDIDNPFQRIIARELYKWLTDSRLVIFYHLNSIPADELFKAHNLFKKKKMQLKQYGKKTLEMAVTGTPYEPVLDFYVSQNIMLFSPELEIKTVFRTSKKFPQLIILAGILEGKFISKDELTYYSLIPNLQVAQSGLVQTLESVGSQVVSHLNSHQTTLVSHLEERVKQLEEEK